MIINKFNFDKVPPLDEEDNINAVTSWCDHYGVMNLTNSNYVAWIDHLIYLNNINRQIRPEESDKLFLGWENSNQHLITRIAFEQPLDRFQLPKAVRTLVMLFWLTIAAVAGYLDSDSFMFWTYWFWLWVIGRAVTRYFKNDYLTCHHLKMMRQRMHQLKHHY